MPSKDGQTVTLKDQVAELKSEVRGLKADVERLKNRQASALLEAATKAENLAITMQTLAIDLRSSWALLEDQTSKIVRRRL